MPEFFCRVATSTGEVFERSYVADDESGLRRDLENQDLMILDVRRRSVMLQQLARTFRLKGHVSTREFTLFNQELRALLKAGLPILPSLDILLERRKNEAFRQSLLDIRDRVRSGEALSEAFAAQGDLFPPLYSASLASAERSGEMVAVLGRFIDYMHKVLNIRRKVGAAMIYPVILITLATVLVAVMVFFIIPKFDDFLSDFDSELPLITRFVTGFAVFCQQQWQIILAIVVGGTIGFALYSRTDGGRLSVDTAKLRLPLVGGIIRAYAQNRFTRTLGTLQAGGIPLVTSLELSARAVGNALYERELVKVAGKVREGRSLWESLDETELLSDISVQMIKVGESTGALDEMLHSASDFTDEEIDAALTRLVAMVEPLMLVFMAVIVGIMLLSIYMPLIQLYGQSGGM